MNQYNQICRTVNTLYLKHIQVLQLMTDRLPLTINSHSYPIQARHPTALNPVRKVLEKPQEPHRFSQEKC